MRLLLTAAAVAVLAFTASAGAQWGEPCTIDQLGTAACRPPMDIRAPAPAAPRHATLPPWHGELPAKFRRQEVGVEIVGLRAGDILIKRARRYLYLVVGENRAIRYGIGVGREGFGELTVGEYYVGRKQKHPWWHPPKAMQERDPKAARYPNGMPPGPHNPLGVRALYLHNAAEQNSGQKGADSLYRIHGTNEPWTIGTAASSGCFRMVDEDIVDLYERVGIGARVVVE